MKAINKQKIIASALALTLITGTMIPTTTIVGAASSVNEEPAISGSVEINTESDYSYYTLNDGTLKITKYTGNDTKITIPSKIDGKEVTSIGEIAFSSCSSLTSVTIPNSITSIGREAFYGCSSLTNVTIPNSVTRIGEYAFDDCSSLTNINVSNENNNYSSMNGVLFNKEKTKLICCPAGKSGAYTIPNSVTEIEESAFYGCSSLTSVTIPNSVTSIGNIAFSGCSSLTSITIPNSVTRIGIEVFNGCSSLADINVSNGNNNYSSMNGILFNKEKTELICCPEGKSGAYTIPNSVTGIGEMAFYGCASLTSVTIPNSVTGIGETAFYGCASLTSVTIPNSVTSIGETAFYGCASLTNITIPNSVTEIGEGAFYGCSSLTSITIPNSVTEITGYAFYGCTSLTSVTIPNSVTEIRGNAFNGCSSLTSVTIPNSVTRIRGSAFYGCSSLTSVTIPNSVTRVGENAFNGCTSLTSIKIPNSVTEIEYSAFRYCSSLTSVSIPNSVTSIGNSAFYGCSSLTSVTIPNSVTEIEYSAFRYCSSLISVTIPNSVTRIGREAFNGCSSLTNINVADENNSYSSINCVLFNKEKTELICYPAGKSGAYTIPNSVTDIGYSAFEDCSSLTSVTIPNSVTEIELYAFSGCSSLKSVSIPNSVTRIGDHAFGYKFNEQTKNYELIPNFIIYGTEGSAAEKYANEYGIAFKTIGTANPLINNSTITATNITAGTAITLNATATGGTAPYKYYYYCKAPNSTKYVQIKADEKTASRTTKPTVAGTYYYSIKVVDANGNYKIKIFTVKVNPALTNNSTITATNITAGTAITLNATATGGTAPYKYYYYCKAPGSNKYVEMKTDVKSASRTTKPTVAGTYYYSIKVVDANGSYKTKIFTVKVNPAFTNNSTISATNIELGDSVTLKASATGGTAPYKYYYYYKASTDTKWIKLNASTSAKSRVTTPTGIKTYNYKINVVDANGTIKSKIFTVTCTVPAEVKKVAEIVNSERKANGLSALTLDTELCNAAAVRSRELVKLFDHTRPDGTDCFTVLKQLGISYMHAGENIAAGYPSPESVMNGWMNSPGHRANILTSEFSKIGVGLYNYNGYKYWVQLFVG